VAKRENKSVVEKEGYLYAIPLRAGGFAIALVVRCGRGKATLISIFDRSFATIPRVEVARPHLSPSRVIHELRTSPLSIRRGHWPELGQLDEYHRDDWPLPYWNYPGEYERKPKRGHAFVARIDECDRVIDVKELPVREAALYDRFGFTGGDFLERQLTLFFEEGISINTGGVLASYEI